MNASLVASTSLSTQFTEEQIAIGRWVAEGVGHAVVIARAGTGKTWTALKMIPMMLSTSAARYCAITMAMFNAPIAAETKGKLAASDIKAWATTFHAAGWSALLRAFPKTKLSGTDPGQAGYDKWTRIVEALDIPERFRSFARKAASMAKQRAFGLTCRLSDPVQWLKIVTDFSLDESISAEYLDSGLRSREDIIKEGLQWAFKALKKSNELIPEVCDHDDQIYGPLIRDVKCFESDWLIVDEAQDTNPARRLLARKMLKRNGRALFIGDPCQAIYLFTGADNDAMDVIIKEWNATVLKLTMTFRCPQIIVRMAQAFVPDYRAAPTNPEGEYIPLKNSDQFYKEYAKTLTPDTAILCRNTAPLVKAAFRLIALSVPCIVIGKDIGGQIIELVNRWRSIKTLRTLRERLTAYLETETAKLLAAKKDAAADSLNDRVETVFAVIEGLPKDATLDDLKAKVEQMFQKAPKGEQEKKRIRLMTGHRSKGLEEDTIVIIGRKELFPSKFAKTDEQFQQERNLEYVMITRTMRRMIDVPLD
jgi:superfamily I DNA/RNA helicase